MSLDDLCALVGGRVPLVIEVKSHFDGDRKLVARMAEVLASYRGPVVGMSFDPDQVLALREQMPELPRGIIAQRSYDEADWPETDARPSVAACCICVTPSAPGRISSPTRVNELPAAAPWIARNMFGLPLLTWTVRTPEQRERAARYADQMIFEGFPAGNLRRSAPLKSRAQCTIFGGLVTMCDG